ncbi:hypothetical protein J7382_07420 [Shimia sp. R11_0]|uniref:hypothetical protein n=1 Tax=Shimia sp. R11_0 TaxID=2821096 RepID=UPI001ADBD931|nr:hypothetical protein [Shimia sp. R11_0]MBO9477358.1 hypothetical protein [Shimia sp. R11_0]
MWFFKGLANVGMTLAFFYFCGWWLFVGWPEKIRREEDPIYAMRLFEDLVPVAEVLATRRYHHRGAEAWDCSFAVVRIADGAPEVPPSRAWDSGMGWQFAFGGDWKPTPSPALGNSTRNALGFCSHDFSKELVAELQRIMTTTGAWYSRDRVGETLYIYAPEPRLAARIRFGD